MNTDDLKLSYARAMLKSVTARWEAARRKRLGKATIFQARVELLYWKRQVRKLGGVK